VVVIGGGDWLACNRYVRDLYYARKVSGVSGVGYVITKVRGMVCNVITKGYCFLHVYWCL